VPATVSTPSISRQLSRRSRLSEQFRTAIEVIDQCHRYLERLAPKSESDGWYANLSMNVLLKYPDDVRRERLNKALEKELPAKLGEVENKLDELLNSIRVPFGDPMESVWAVPQSHVADLLRKTVEAVRATKRAIADIGDTDTRLHEYLQHHTAALAAAALDALSAARAAGVRVEMKHFETAQLARSLIGAELLALTKHKAAIVNKVNQPSTARAKGPTHKQRSTAQFKPNQARRRR
jgi:hypothetical protein